jgi:hypothetical protein
VAPVGSLAERKGCNRYGFATPCAWIWYRRPPADVWMTRVPSTLPIVRGRKTMEMLSASPGASVVALKEEGWKCTLSVVTEKTESSVSAPLFSSAISTAGMQRGLCLNSKLGGSIETREAEVMARGVDEAASARSAPEQLIVATAAARDHHQSGGPRRGAGRARLILPRDTTLPNFSNFNLQ